MMHSMHALRDFVAEKGYKNGYVLWPIRTAVSGKQMTPAWRNRDHGSHRQRGIISKDPCSDRKVAERNLKSI